MTDFYTPTFNGTAGFEEFGEEAFSDDNTVSFCGAQRSHQDAYDSAVADVWLEEYHNERFAQDSLPLDWADEYHFGLPDRCPSKWADGALVFKPGWDSCKAARVRPDRLSRVSHPGVLNPGCSRVSPSNYGDHETEER